MATDNFQQIRFISPVGSVGGGISSADLDEALTEAPSFIACDAGTTDAGPFSLGMGIPAFPREAVKRDLSLMLRAGREANIPVIIGSAGTAGGDVHVDWVLEIAREVVAEHHLTLRTAVIYAEQDKAYLKRLLRQNRILPLDPAPPISEGIIGSSRIVGMMGVELLQQAIASSKAASPSSRTSVNTWTKLGATSNQYPLIQTWSAHWNDLSLNQQSSIGRRKEISSDPMNPKRHFEEALEMSAE